MKVPPKKLTRVSFVGVSNLPAQKANELGSALQRIVTAAAETHNACDDARIDVDAKFTSLVTLAQLGDVVERVSSLASEEASLGAPFLREELTSFAKRIAQHAESLRKGFSEYNQRHPQRAKLASGIFQSLLLLAQDTIELLRISDRGTCAKLSALVVAARTAAQSVNSANSLESLQRATNNMLESSVTISKRFQRRADVFDEGDHARKVEKATKALELATSVFLSEKESALLNGSEEQVSLEDINRALNFLDELALASPEFSVILEVEYFDDNTGLSLAALLEASRKGNAEAMVQHARELVSAIETLLREGQRAAIMMASPEKDKVLESCKEAHAAMLDVIQTSKEVFNMDSPPPVRFHLSQQQHNAALRLRKAAHGIPSKSPLVLVRQKSTLANSAMSLLEGFNALLTPTPSTSVVM